MTTAIIVLVLVAAVVAISIVRPGDPAAQYTGAYRDRDQERRVAELHALTAHQTAQSTWNPASRAASASTSRSTWGSRRVNGTHRTSPSV